MKFLALLFIASCGMNEITVTIPQGVYGVLSDGDTAAKNVPVTVYKAGAVGIYASGTSDESGLYQIDLSNGDYTLCTTGCTSISTPSSATVRYDWTDGPDGGTWDKI
ncbi:MAG: hypothetical protein QM831_25910 [Kofleriaceae bacterium]